MSKKSWPILYIKLHIASWVKTSWTYSTQYPLKDGNTRSLARAALKPKLKEKKNQGKENGVEKRGVEGQG